MRKLFLVSVMIFSLFAENNTVDEVNTTIQKTTSNEKLTEMQVKEQMAREASYAQTQSFAQGDDYNLKAVEVNQKSLDNIPSIEPDYDFDMTDVYRDDL